MRRMIAACVLAGFLPLVSTGCFGGFQLTRKVYQYNQQASPDKWVQEIVFLVLTIVPIYGGATFLDAVIFNSIEFWTGRNPILAANGDSQTIQTADGAATLTRVSADTLEVTLRPLDGSEEHFLMVREAEGFAARAPDGALIARAAEVGGRPAIVQRAE